MGLCWAPRAETSQDHWGLHCGFRVTQRVRSGQEELRGTEARGLVLTLPVLFGGATEPSALSAGLFPIHPALRAEPCQTRTLGGWHPPLGPSLLRVADLDVIRDCSPPSLSTSGCNWFVQQTCDWIKTHLPIPDTHKCGGAPRQFAQPFLPSPE